MLKKLFVPLKLQLFAESGESQEVAVPGTEETTVMDEGAEGAQSTSVEGTEVAVQSTDVNEVPQQTLPTQTEKRDFERDAAFARIRREAEQAKKQNELLAKTLQQFGFDGATPEETIDKANAHYLQKPIEEVRAQRLEAEKRQQEEAQRQAQLDYYRMRDAQRMMADDLARIQKLDPTVKKLEDLGQDYFKLIEAGIDAEIAFNAVNQKKQRETKTPPVEIGKVNSGSKEEKDFYTSAEVDRLSKKDLENPKIRARVMESMTKW